MKLIEFDHGWKTFAVMLCRGFNRGSLVGIVWIFDVAKLADSWWWVRAGIVTSEAWRDFCSGLLSYFIGGFPASDSFC